MKKEKMFKVSSIISLCGLAGLLVSAIQVIITGGKMEFWIIATTISFLFFIAPLFISIIFHTAGLILDFSEMSRKVERWINIIFYVVVFPLLTIWFVGALDTLFNWFPNYQEAIYAGKSMEVVEVLYKAHNLQLYTTVMISYGAMIVAGLIIRASKRS